MFSGRFTTVEPAAVEVHATYSGFSDEVSAVESAVEITADSEQERQFLPEPATLQANCCSQTVDTRAPRTSTRWTDTGEASSSGSAAATIPG